ncbi:MAG: hypothetical protein R6U52_08025 [Kosmotogaceae bacterium]
MSVHIINFWLWILGIIYSLMALNTLTGFIYAEQDIIFGIVLGVSAGIYFFGIRESLEKPQRRAAHLLIGTMFSSLLGLFKFLILLGSSLSGYLEQNFQFTVDSFNLSVIIGSVITLVIHLQIRKQFV